MAWRKPISCGFPGLAADIRAGPRKGDFTRGACPEPARIAAACPALTPCAGALNSRSKRRGHGCRRGANRTIERPAHDRPPRTATWESEVCGSAARGDTPGVADSCACSNADRNCRARDLSLNGRGPPPLRQPIDQEIVGTAIDVLALRVPREQEAPRCGSSPRDGLGPREGCELVWCPKSNLKKFPMDFVPRQGARRSHSRAMATPSNEAFGAKDAEIIQGIFGTPH